LTKFHQMMNKYQYLLLMESTKEAPASEFVMVERMFVGEEKQSLERLKEETRVAKELQLTPVCRPVVKCEPGSESSSTTSQLHHQFNGKREKESPEDVALTSTTAMTTTATMTTTSTTPRMTPKMALLKFTRKEGEGYRSELQEYKEEFSGSEDMEEEGVIYDEDITAQMQNAIDDLLKLNGGCDEGPTGGQQPSPANYTIQNGGASMENQLNQFNSQEMQVDLALNEAVKSIL